MTDIDAGRLGVLDPEALSAEQAAVYRAIVAGPRGDIRGPFGPWLLSPELAGPAQQLGEYCRFRSALPARLRELAILITGQRWQAQFEFWAHARLGAAAGLDAGLIEDLRLGRVPAALTDDERAVYRFVTEYFATSRVSEDAYHAATAALGERGVLDLVAIVGYYGLVCMTLNVFAIGVPEGEPRPFGDA